MNLKFGEGVLDAIDKHLGHYGKWDVHICRLDKHCRKVGKEYGIDYPPRVHINTPWGQLMLSYWLGGSSQLWLPRLGYTKFWSPITWHPARRDGS